MKISKKEKYLLGILATVLISILYYQFIYINQVEKLDVKKKEKAEIETRYNGVMESIKTLESRKENLKILNSSILDKASDFYPTILQEKIILEIDKLLTDSGLKGNIAFSPIEVASVETMVAPEVAKAESSMKIITDEYNGSYKPEEKTKKQETPNAR